MRTRLLITAIAVSALMICIHAEAVPVWDWNAGSFIDTFDSENGRSAQLNYNGFTNWTVLNGTVDLIGEGSTWDYYPGNGLYVDLDGSTNNAGTLQSKWSFYRGGVATYALSFDLGGSFTPARPGENNTVDVTMSLGAWSTFITLGQNANLERHYFTFETFVSGADSGNLLLSFHNRGGDNVGLILDNVALSGEENAVQVDPTTPELGTWLLLACTGLVGLVPRLRRRRK